VVEPTPEGPSLLNQMMATATATLPPAEPIADWSYDESGIVRVNNPRVTFPAAVLTWLNAALKEKLPAEDLAQLRAMSPEQVAEMQLTAGRPPLFLRQARVPTNLDMLTGRRLPALVQTDSASQGFGPWAVLVRVADESVLLHDPRSGRLELPRELLEDHLAGIVVPFQDREGLVGLRPPDRGARVRALQLRLREAGVYMIEPSAIYDPFTEAAVEQYRKDVMVPGGTEIDPLLALTLLEETEPKAESQP
jgi:hypothetical protein